MILRILLAAALLATPALAVPVRKPAAQATNWVGTVAATPEGGFRIGNPAARVKLIEYASLTCPHCRRFHEAAMAPLRAKYVATGKVSYEYRNYVLNGPDFAASLLARCDGGQAFFARVDTLYRTQEQWTQPYTTLDQGVADQLAKLPPEAQIAGLAKAGGLDGFMAARGMTRPRIAQCLADKAAQDRLTGIARTASEQYKITGTPGFLINGKLAMAGDKPVSDWASLEPALIAALR